MSSDEDGAPLGNVIVIAKKVGDKKILAHSMTNNKGQFKVDLQPEEGFWLHFSVLGYANDSIELKVGKNFYEIKLQEKKIELKEVKVTAKSISARGDTVRYLVSNFKEIQDKNLADVLKKMPGIEVAETGQIKYQGQAINRFYIEGRDMLGGRYGVATNTINPSDVGSVEVMERHQPIKALEDISFSQNPAINIRLKEDAKSHWVGTATLGAGCMDVNPSFLWNGQVTIMRFKKENQILNTGKSTNTGRSATSFGANLIFDTNDSPFGVEYSLYSPLSVSLSLPYQLDLDRTRKGPSHMISSNNLWGIGENIDLTSKVNYSHRTDISRSDSEMVYILNDGNRVIESEEDAKKREQNLSVETNLLINKPQLYLSNKLSGDFAWNSVNLITMGTYPNDQVLRGEQQGIENRLNLLIRKGNGGISINSFMKWQRRPDRLQVTMPAETQIQNITSQLLFTNTSTSLSYIMGRIVFSAKLGIATMNRSLESNLDGMDVYVSPLTNDVKASYHQFYATPVINFNYKIFKSELEMPVAWTSYRIESGKATKLHRFPISPRIRIELQANTRLKFSAIARYRNEILDDQGWYNGYILRNYRTLSLGLEELGKRSSGMVTLNVGYRNALEALFVNTAVNYSRFKSSHLNSREFADRYVLLRPVAQTSHGSNWSFSSRISKGFTWLRSVLGLNFLYLVGNDEILQQKSSNTLSP